MAQITGGVDTKTIGNSVLQSQREVIINEKPNVEFIISSGTRTRKIAEKVRHDVYLPGPVQSAPGLNRQTLKNGDSSLKSENNLVSINNEIEQTSKEAEISDITAQSGTTSGEIGTYALQARLNMKRIMQEQEARGKGFVASRARGSDKLSSISGSPATAAGSIYSNFSAAVVDGSITYPKEDFLDRTPFDADGQTTAVQEPTSLLRQEWTPEKITHICNQILVGIGDVQGRSHSANVGVSSNAFIVPMPHNSLTNLGFSSNRNTLANLNELQVMADRGGAVTFYVNLATLKSTDLNIILMSNRSFAGETDLKNLTKAQIATKRADGEDINQKALVIRAGSTAFAQSQVARSKLAVNGGGDDIVVTKAIWGWYLPHEDEAVVVMGLKNTLG